MKKGLVTILVLLIAATTAFAVGEAESGSSDGPITLQAYHYRDLTNDITTTNWEELMAGWEENFPDIKLEFEYLFNDPYHDKLQSMAVAGQLPDVMFLWPGKRTGYVTGQGLVKDISPWIDKVKDQFAPAAVAAQGPNGEMWELPEQVTATHVMFTNTRILDELGLEFPKTYAELLEQGPAIRDAGYIPIAMDNKDGWQMQSCFLSALVARTGGKKWLDAARTGSASFTDDEFVSALAVINELSEKEMFSPGVNQADYGEALDAFSAGEAVYLIDGGWRTNELVKLMPEDAYTYVEYNVFPPLSNEGGIKASSAIIAGTGIGMNAKLEGAKAEAAWEWIYYFAGPVGSTIKAGQGWLPAVKIDLPSDIPPLLASLSTFLNSTPGGYVIDGVMDAEGMGILHPAIQEMMFGNKTPAQAAGDYENWVAANDSSRK
jgi:raffinose/stachyose/melibiose transport system substrate-binding protein